VISIIVPTLNEEKVLARCLQSLNSQSYSGEKEVIVSDGYSKDSTRKIARGMGARVVKEKKRTPAAERQKGAEAAKGELLVFCDADAVYAGDWLEELLKPFDDPKVVVAHGRILVDDGTHLENLLTGKGLTPLMALSNWLGFPNGAGSSLAIRRSVFDKTGGFDVEMATGEDVFLQRKALKHGKSVYCKSSVAFVSPRRLRKWGYAKLVSFHLKNWFKTQFLNSYNEDYERVR
jgi:cellulose synthase/poly-beta-1,6-N-acetylglucosamine synthase-like glycosyltransferase